MPRPNPSYRNLMTTNRSVKFRGPWLVVPIAGEDRWINLEFNSKHDALRCGKSLVAVLREDVAAGNVRDDVTYNARIMMWLVQVAEYTKKNYDQRKAEEGIHGEEDSQTGSNPSAGETCCTTRDERGVLVHTHSGV